MELQQVDATSMRTHLDQAVDAAVDRLLAQNASLPHGELLAEARQAKAEAEGLRQALAVDDEEFKRLYAVVGVCSHDDMMPHHALVLVCAEHRLCADLKGA